MTTDTFDRPGFDIVRVISQTIAVLGRNAVSFGLLALVLVGLPTLVVLFAQAGLMKGAVQGAQTGNFDFSPAGLMGVSLGGLATLVTTSILQGALMHATVQDLNGQPQSMGDSLATGLRHFLPLIAVTILLVLAFAFGMVLLVVPGLMLACAWCVAAPALVADRTGVFGAFSRAADLTRGHRWQIFGLGVIVVIAEMIIGVIFNAIDGVSPFGADPARVAQQLLSPVFLIVTAVRSTVGAVIGATAIAVLYVELRRAREGEPTGWLADIFS